MDIKETDVEGSEEKVDVKEENRTDDEIKSKTDDEIKTKSETLDIKRETLKDGTIDIFSNTLENSRISTLEHHRYHR